MVISLNGAALSYYNGNQDRFGYDPNSLQTVRMGGIFFRVPQVDAPKTSTCQIVLPCLKH